MVIYMLRHSTLVIFVKKMSIELERVLWKAIDIISDGDWKAWVLNALVYGRDGVGRATYLRTVLFVETNLSKINTRHATIR